VVARRRKGSWGGFREGSGRKSELQEPHRYSMDFEAPQMKALSEIAEEEGVSIATVIREACAQYITRKRRK
jgi:hypothetical protein